MCNLFYLADEIQSWPWHLWGGTHTTQWTEKMISKVYRSKQPPSQCTVPGCYCSGSTVPVIPESRTTEECQEAYPSVRYVRINDHKCGTSMDLWISLQLHEWTMYPTICLQLHVQILWPCAFLLLWQMCRVSNLYSTHRLKCTCMFWSNLMEVGVNVHDLFSRYRVWLMKVLGHLVSPILQHTTHTMLRLKVGHQVLSSLGYCNPERRP